MAPLVPFEPPERYLPLEEADGERVSVTGYVSTFNDPPDRPVKRRQPFGFYAAFHDSGRNRHRVSVPRRHR